MTGTISPREFAEEKQVTYTTVIRWLLAGKIPEAVKEEPTPGLTIWKIPRAALKTFQMPRAGRRPGWRKEGSKKAAKGKEAK